MFLLILERKEGGEGENESKGEGQGWGGEKNIDGLPPVQALTRDGTCNLGMCPDWALSPWPSDAQDHAPTSRAT